MSGVDEPARTPGEVPEDYDPEDVAAWCLRQRWFTTGPWDTEFQKREIHPKVLALYRKDRARELEREKRGAAERTRLAQMWAEAAAARERAAEQARRMRDMRRWGPENGYFVGTRGCIPRRVVEAYNQAHGIEEGDSS